METIYINNVSYAVEFHQSKEHLPYLFMLHGFMSDHRVFDHLIDDLVDFCNPITADLLGYGESSKPANPERYRETNQIRDLRGIINELEFPRLFLCGYSMGGRLAIKMAVDSPEYFDGLLLESTNCGISDPEKRKKRQKIDATRAQKMQKDFGEFLSGWKELEIFHSPLPENEALVRKYRKIQSEQSPSALAASLLGFGTGSMTPVCETLQKIQLPVLLIAGSEDEKYQQINRYMAKQFSDATFSSIEAGHRTHLDNPEAYVSEIRKFIQDNF